MPDDITVTTPTIETMSEGIGAPAASPFWPVASLLEIGSDWRDTAQMKEFAELRS